MFGLFKDPSPSTPMFIPKEERMWGIVTSVEKCISKATGEPYIRIGVNLGDGNPETFAVFGRIPYTIMVLQHKWTHLTEEEVVNLLLGTAAEATVSRTVSVDGIVYPGINFKSFGRTRDAVS